MDLTHRFSVPARLDEAWRAFNDLEGLAPCFPGATVSGVEGDEFAGSVKVRLGPIALLYTGSGRYVERDDAEHRVVIEARGKDKRGNGTATATVTASFRESGEQTDVEVLTDLAITGKPAQFGRGVISDVSDKLLDQFVDCVSERFAARVGDTEPAAAGMVGSPAEQAVSPRGEAGAGSNRHQLPHGGEPAPGSAAAPPNPSTQAAPAEAQASREPGQPAAPTPEAAAPRPIRPPRPIQPPRPVHSAQPARTQEDLNLLGTVVPVLLKRYGPILAVAGLLLLLLIKIIRRRS